MKKADRLNQELIYLSYKKKFNLSEITTKFQISPRTALRDIAELEEMGLPLYSKVGRNGGYIISQEKLWVPIKFNLEEINAIFFALKSMDLVSTTPFKKSFSSIYQKLLKSLSLDHQKQITHMQDIVKYRREPSIDNSENLTILLKAATQNLAINCYNEQTNHKQTLQIANIFYQNGIWYTEAYDLIKDIYRIYKCKQLKKLSFNDKFKVKNLSELKNIRKIYFQKFRTINYCCQLTQRGKNIVLRDLYPNMEIKEKNDTYYLIGHYNQQELEYMVQYLLKLGPEVKIIKPKELKQAYLKQVKNILHFYK